MSKDTWGCGEVGAAILGACMRGHASTGCGEVGASILGAVGGDGKRTTGEGSEGKHTRGVGKQGCGEARASIEGGGTIGPVQKRMQARQAVGAAALLWDFARQHTLLDKSQPIAETTCLATATMPTARKHAARFAALADCGRLGHYVYALLHVHELHGCCAAVEAGRARAALFFWCTLLLMGGH